MLFEGGKNICLTLSALLTQQNGVEIRNHKSPQLKAVIIVSSLVYLSV